MRPARFFFADKAPVHRHARAMFELGIDKGVARLVVNRPEARNAIPVSGWAALAERAEQAERGGARLLIVSGSGDAFCAGADISDFPAMKEDEAARTRFRLAMRDGLDRLRDLPIPTIAAIHGPCFGAGVALAMACDLRVSGDRAHFAITPAKFGISYPQEDVYRLVSLIGTGQASLLLFGAGGIDGAEAERIGLVEIHAGDRLAETVEEMAAAILANSAASLRALKISIRLAADGDARDDEQDRLFESLFGSAELAERLASRARRGE
jgi:enoyl-CoA hydratase/carnithine racemase